MLNTKFVPITKYMDIKAQFSLVSDYTAIELYLSVTLPVGV